MTYTNTLDLYLQDKALTSDKEQTLTHSIMWERSHSVPYETTYEDDMQARDYMLYGISALVNVEADDDFGTLSKINGKSHYTKTVKSDDGVTVFHTKQNAKAVPIFYSENANHPLVEVCTNANYRNVYDIAKERSIKVSAMLSKLCYHRNRQSNIIIFIVDTQRCYKQTWSAIFNAIVNNKAVVVRFGNHSFKHLAYGNEEFNTLSDMFWSAHRENKYQSMSNRKIENEALRLSQLPYTTLNLNRAIVAELVSNLWELDYIAKETDFKVVLETFTAYLKGGLESTRAIGITVKESYETEESYLMRQSAGDELLNNIVKLPLEILEILVPLLTIEIRTVESFGNEDYLESLYEDEGYDY